MSIGNAESEIFEYWEDMSHIFVSLFVKELLVECSLKIMNKKKKLEIRRGFKQGCTFTQ